MPAGDAAVFARNGEHCEGRRCRQPVAIVTWSWFTLRGKRRISERFLCEDHGQDFARRHNVEIS